MTKMETAIDALEKSIAQLSESIDGLSKVLHKCEAPPNAPAENLKPEKPVTLVAVRAALAEKSQSGKQPAVKALIEKYGATKLTDIDPSHYADLLCEAEAL